MTVDEIEAPICQHQEDKDETPCGRRMFRIGTAAIFGFVCEECDKVDTERSLD